MIVLSNPSHTRICQCCGSGKEVLEIYFRNEETNRGAVIALCLTCQKEMIDKMIERCRKDND